MYRFEIFKDKADAFRFRFRASNGEIMFSSEGYSQKASALKSIESLKRNVPSAEIDDQTSAEA